MQRASFPSTVSSTMNAKPDGDAEPIVAVPEQEEGGEAQHRADRGYRVGRKPGLRRPARQVKGRPPPQIQRQRVGDALVGRIIGRALDLLGGVGRQRQHERPVALPEVGIGDLGGFGVELGHAWTSGGPPPCHRRRDRARRRRPPRHGRAPARPPLAMTVPGLAGEHLQPGRVPGKSEVAEHHRPAVGHFIGAVEARLGRQPAGAGRSHRARKLGWNCPRRGGKGGRRRCSSRVLCRGVADATKVGEEACPCRDRGFRAVCRS